MRTDLNAKTHQLIQSQQQILAERVVERQYDQQLEIWRRYGKLGWTKSVRDAVYHLSYLSEAMLAHDPSLFFDYVEWVNVLFANLGFPDEVLPMTLRCLRDVLEESLPSEMQSILDEYVRAGLEKVAHLSVELPTFLSSEGPLSDLAQNYLQALLEGDRHTANRLIIDAVDGGTTIKDLYLHVFERSQHEIGRLWQMNRISVAQEHYCTAATQVIMSQLYPQVFAAERVGRRLVAACISGELHEIGLRMVADFFEMEGWDTYYLGANTPSTSIIQAIEDQGADILAISATMTFHLSEVVDLVDQVRGHAVGSKVRILVGGNPFNTAPGLWQQIGADGHATDAQEAIAIANKLLAGGEM
jgi:methanogenic corrinoid protein MtbC1